jgi:hypothetical protein
MHRCAAWRSTNLFERIDGAGCRRRVAQQLRSIMLYPVDVGSRHAAPVSEPSQNYL